MGKNPKFNVKRPGFKSWFCHRFFFFFFYQITYLSLIIFINKTWIKWSPLFHRVLVGSTLINKWKLFWTIVITCRHAQSCPTLCNPVDCSPPGSCPWDFPEENSGVSCHFLLQGNLSRLGIEPVSPAWKVESLPVSHLGSPHFAVGLRWELQPSLVPQYLLCDRHTWAQKKGFRQEWRSP